MSNARMFEQQIQRVSGHLATLRARRDGQNVGDPEWDEALEDLRITLEELQVTQEELRQQNEQLAAAQDKIEAERRRYRGLFEFAPDGYLVTDPAGVIREANRAAAWLLSVPEHYLAGKPLASYVALPERKAFRQRLLRLPEQRRALQWEVRLVPRKGAPIDVSLAVAQVRDNSDRLTGLRWLIRDVSDRKHAEDQVRALNADLERRVAERTAQLAAANAAKDELLERERSARALAEMAVCTRDHFLEAISHDLRTPLTAARGLAQLLQRQAARLDAPGAEDLVEGLSTIESATTRMAGMIDELLDLGRVQSGQPLELDRGRTDLVAVVRNAAAEQRAEHARIRIEPAEGALVGSWDAGRLHRVVANLLANAVKYSSPGSEVRVTVAREPRTAATEPAAAWAVLVVRDQGIGIPAADLPHIFERFYRASNVAGRIRGTGIGLDGARQIVEQHGGTITVDSREGQGTTVTVRLPLS